MQRGFTDTILMIRPAAFGFNAQTAVSNAFQNRSEDSEEKVRDSALEEFDRLVAVLRSEGIEVMVIDDTEDPIKPDAVFPNNWISFHQDGSIITYPMRTRNRREEYRPDIVEKMMSEYGFNNEVQLGHYTSAQIYLEGTGSMVLDRENKVCYACLSPRTDERLLQEFCKLKQYELIVFDALDRNGKDVYHTNVVMALGNGYAVVCLASIEDEDEREEVVGSLEGNGKKVIDITFDQMEAFAGNMLHLTTKAGANIVVCSAQAKASLSESQIIELERHAKIVSSDIKTIETIGGGGVRCMITEVFKP